jgi:hypothetical protein
MLSLKGRVKTDPSATNRTAQFVDTGSTNRIGLGFGVYFVSLNILPGDLC